MVMNPAKKIDRILIRSLRVGTEIIFRNGNDFKKLRVIDIAEIDNGQLEIIVTVDKRTRIPILIQSSSLGNSVIEVGTFIKFFDKDKEGEFNKFMGSELVDELYVREP